MHIDWPTLGIWFLAAVGFFAFSVVLVWITGWVSSGTLVEFLIFVTALWIFSTGIVRSVSPWNVPLCWVAGLVLIYPSTFLLWLPIVSILSIGHFVSKRWRIWYRR